MTQYETFGQWVKQRRKELDLTQAALAQQVGYSLSALMKIEAGQRRPSRQVAERLADVLNLAADDRVAFVRAARVGLSAVLAPPPANLVTPRTRFIGREHESALVRALLGQPSVRLLTLSGPGGIGKTRLALHMAAQIHHEFAHGVYFVALVSLRDSSLVLATIARALGIADTGQRPLIETLVAHLHNKHLLLILDNIEHLVAAAPDVSALLAQTTGLKLLITSRTRLRLAEEHEYLVPPLPLPNMRRLPAPYVLAETASIALFIARAHTVQPDFVLTDANATTVAAICTQLEGVPLAIELAAVSIRFFSLIALLDRLRQRLSLLSGGLRDAPARHQGLRAVVAWSVDLLDSEARTLFIRMGVCVGGCTLTAIEAICVCQQPEHSAAAAPYSQSPSLLAQLNTLLDSNLIWQEQAGDREPRFMMLEMMRDYALEQLDERGESEVLRRQHAMYYLALVEQAEDELRGPAQPEWLDRLEDERDNLRAAFSWYKASGQTEHAARMAGSLWPFWAIRGYLREGGQWLDLLLRDDAGLPAAVRATVFYARGALAWLQSEYRQAQLCYEVSLQLYRTLGDQRRTAGTLSNLGLVAWRQARYEQARTLFEESLTLFREVDDTRGIAHALDNLGSIATNQCDFVSAHAYHSECLVLRREQGDQLGVAVTLNNLGLAAQGMGDYARAQALLEESIALGQAMGARRSIPLKSFSAGSAYARPDGSELSTIDKGSTLRSKIASRATSGRGGAMSRFTSSVYEQHIISNALYSTAHLLYCMYRATGDGHGLPHAHCHR